MRRQLLAFAALSLAIGAAFDVAAQTRLRRQAEMAQTTANRAQQAPSREREFVPVTDAMLKNPADGDWLMWRRTLNGWGYSPLKEIDKRNVAKLEQVWSAPIGTGNQESTPLVYNGVMYMPNGGDYVQAFDAKAGTLKWEYRRFAEPRGGTNRNLAIWGTTLIDAGADNMMYAIDARDGKLVWETKVLEPNLPARASSGPIIANGKVITGRQCQPQATHESCVITAHDAATGKELWRTRTIPRKGEPGDETWGDVPMEQRWHVGTWMVPSYDPELDRIYVGTSVTIPAPKFILGGAELTHLYHNSTLALDPTDGHIVWYYQHLNDHWDLDHPFERLLVDTVVAPDPSEVAWISPRVQLNPAERRQVMTGIPGKTGIVYTLDRATGEFLWARPTVFQNVVKSIDGLTGEVEVDPARIFREKGHSLMVCPGTNGGKNWPAGAYSPRTNAMYMPMQNMCMNATVQSGERDPRLVYGFSSEYIAAPGAENIGVVWAISAEKGTDLWKHEQRSGHMSLAATGGGLVFGGDVAGNFHALDDETGETLWEVNLGAPVSGFPVSFAVDGKQYVAVTTGGSLVAGAARRVTPELSGEPAPSQVYVFALP